MIWWEPSARLRREGATYERIRTKRNVAIIITATPRTARETALAAPTLAQVEARSAGFDQVLFVDEPNNVTEGSASNSWIVRDGMLITREPGPKVLAGVTRARLIASARGLQLKVVERTFSVKEALSADEAFLTSATALIVPIARLNSVRLMAPGPITTRLFDAYRQFAFG